MDLWFFDPVLKTILLYINFYFFFLFLLYNTFMLKKTINP